MDEGAVLTEAREGGHFQVPKVNPGSGRSHRTCRATGLEDGRGWAGPTVKE